MTAISSRAGVQFRHLELFPFDLAESLNQGGIMSLSLRKTGTAAALAAFLLVASLAPVPAAAAHSCQYRIHRAEENLRKAVHRHGEHRRQAAQRRRELESLRAYCRDGRY